MKFPDAYDEIRELLASRTQADPLLTAQDIWDLLEGWPVPNVRTVQRYMDHIRNEKSVVERHNVVVCRQTSPRHVG
jgi:hypothetical protein